MKSWFWETFLPMWAKASLLEDNRQLRRDNHQLRHKLRELESYIRGLETGIRSTRKITIHGGNQ